MRNGILGLNAGVSTLRLAIFGIGSNGQLGDRICRAEVDAIGSEGRLIVEPHPLLARGLDAWVFTGGWPGPADWHAGSMDGAPLRIHDLYPRIPDPRCRPR